jgi:hypothetical protein
MSAASAADGAVSTQPAAAGASVGDRRRWLILAVGAVICGTLLRRGVLAGQGDSGHQDTADPQPEASRLATADQDH